MIEPVEAPARPAQNKTLSWDEIVWTDPERMSGAPCFTGTRVPIKNFFDYIEGGDTLNDFLDGFPGVTREQALGALRIGKQQLLNGSTAF